VTDLLDQAIVDALLALLQADVSLTTFDGVVPSNPTPNPPYCVAYFHIARPEDDDDLPLTNYSRVWVARAIVHAIGGNAKAARAVAERVRTNFLDVVPVVAGLTCGPIRMEESQPPTRDETTGPPYMDAVSTYRMRATS
jgi:hypothetical protein